DNSNNNMVVGNVMQRVRVWGSAGSGAAGDGNVVGGPDPADRNFITGYGYVNSEGLPSGTAVELAGVSNTRIENNWIGLSVDGLSQGNLSGNMGIGFQGTNNNTVIVNNRIAGILGHGQGPHHAGQLFGWAVMIGGSGAGITISGNTIGLDANDQPLLGSVWGVDVGTWNYATISDITIEDNEIAGHYFNGITVGRDVAQVRIARNEFHANGWGGIDLIPTGYGYGVTLNDALDADTGGNGLQNFPLLADATSNGATMTVGGSMHGMPSSDFTLEFFASPACDTSGHGEGEQFLGTTSVTTDASGDAVFVTVLPATAPGGWVLTATATLEPLGATSEFSACVGITEEISTNVADGAVPARLEFLGGHPNPFNPTTEIRYALTGPGLVTLDIFNVQGRRVRGLVKEEQIAGEHRIVWDGRDDAGRNLPSGSYFARLRAGELTRTVKLTLIR
ncbi:MAG: T9SS type A sorting domain-containing protein, partial [Gemmatimonadetes bacterium]|nr:T9SS type A sorting domain-containing protein [Gemmatimonadota bacterium]